MWNWKVGVRAVVVLGGVLVVVVAPVLVERELSLAGAVAFVAVTVSFLTETAATRVRGRMTKSGAPRGALPLTY
jgi:hypothetical protein